MHRGMRAWPFYNALSVLLFLLRRFLPPCSRGNGSSTFRRSRVLSKMKARRWGWYQPTSAAVLRDTTTSGSASRAASAFSVSPAEGSSDPSSQASSALLLRCAAHTLAAEPPRSEQERGQGSLRASKRVLTKRARTISIALGLAVIIHEEKSFVEGDEELLKGFARGAGDAPARGDEAEFPTHVHKHREEAVAHAALHSPPAFVHVLLTEHELLCFFYVSKTMQVLVLRWKKTDEVRVISDI